MRPEQQQESVEVRQKTINERYVLQAIRELAISQELK